MLDFKELPKDGVRFEQLIREILMKKGLNPLWTGQGADSGRDLLVQEALSGAIQNSERLWLVDCKHKAHSNNSVGVKDVTDIRDRCARISAQGLLIACTTAMSSELSRKLEELRTKAQLAIEVWDAVTIERLLLTPASYFIAQQFFPRSLAEPAWKLYYTESERRWIAHFKGYFFYVECRDGIDPPPLGDLESIVSQLERVPLAKDEHLRVRLIWHDTRNGPFYRAAMDYLVPSDRPPSLQPEDLYVRLGGGYLDGGAVDWHLLLQVWLPMSDSASLDDPSYYSGISLSSQDGFFGRLPLTYFANHGRWVKVEPPGVRSFNDQLMWERDKEKFGFKKVGNASVAQGLPTNATGTICSDNSQSTQEQSSARPVRSARRKKRSTEQG